MGDEKHVVLVSFKTGLQTNTNTKARALEKALARKVTNAWIVGSTIAFPEYGLIKTSLFDANNTKQEQAQGKADLRWDRKMGS